MDEGTQSKEWWSGYYRGIEEASKTWATAVYECVSDADLSYTILDAANKELGLRGGDDPSAA